MFVHLKQLIALAAMVDSGKDPEPRDAVKRLALESAGVPLLEFREGVSTTEVEDEVRRSLLDRY